MDNSIGKKIKIESSDGQSEIYNVLFTFRSDDLHRSYVLVYPTSETGKPDLGIRAYRLPGNEDPTSPTGGRLKEPQTKKEWDVIESVLNTFMTPD